MIFWNRAASMPPEQEKVTSSPAGISCVNNAGACSFVPHVALEAIKARLRG